MTEGERTALTLPDEQSFKRDFTAINRFQLVVRQNMTQGHDYGVIPGTGNKPTLLKPGAEKIAKLLGLADRYEIISQSEDWDRPFFRYLIRCQLVSMNSMVISEGLGECNSFESKYRYRWAWPNEVEGSDKTKMTKRKIRTKRGEVTQYRVDNDDVYSQVNTILKMAKKRSLVDAALSAGRLSDVFTQDIEDMADMAPEPVAQTESEPQPEQPQSEAPKGQRDPKSITNVGELYTACHKDFGMYKDAILKEAGVSSEDDIRGKEAEIYTLIASLKQEPEEQ